MVSWGVATAKLLRRSGRLILRTSRERLARHFERGRETEQPRTDDEDVDQLEAGQTDGMFDVRHKADSTQDAHASLSARFKPSWVERLPYASRFGSLTISPSITLETACRPLLLLPRRSLPPRGSTVNSISLRFGHALVGPGLPQAYQQLESQTGTEPGSRGDDADWRRLLSDRNLAKTSSQIINSLPTSTVPHTRS
jgi:hypothetical protein